MVTWRMVVWGGYPWKCAGARLTLLFTMGGQSMPVWPLSGGREGLSGISGGRPAPQTTLELRGSPRLKTPIPHSNPRILNTYKEILINNKNALILDVWWFNIPAPVELRGPPRLKPPNSTFKPSGFKHPQRNLGPKQNCANFRCLVI
jgi:hypothetical protein